MAYLTNLVLFKVVLLSYFTLRSDASTVSSFPVSISEESFIPSAILDERKTDVSCSIGCQGFEAGCETFVFDHETSTCTIGNLTEPLLLAPEGQGLKIYLNTELQSDIDTPHVFIMGATGTGMANMVYSTNPMLSGSITIPERPCEGGNCHGSISVEFDGGILSCGGGYSLLCHHFAWGGTAWTTKPSMTRAHFRGKAVVLGGTKVWVSGGSIKTDVFENGAWTEGPDLLQSCSFHTFEALSDVEVILVTGGGICGSKSEIYSFTTNSWRQSEKQLRNRRDMGFSVFVNPAGKRTVIGVGGEAGTTRYSDVEFFDIDTEQWTSGPDFPYATKKVQMVTINNVPWAFGGVVNPKKVFSYDAKTSSWVEQHSLSLPTAAAGDHSLVAWNVTFGF